MKPFSAVRACLLVATLAVVGATAVPVIAQQGAAKPVAAETDTPASLEAFEYGLTAAQSGRYEAAVEYFRTAAKGGDSDPMVSAPHKRSRKPEVWFNLGLAESRVPGLELHAIAAFKYHLILSPNASNADAIRQKIRTLEVASIEQISAAAEKIAALIPPYLEGKDYMRRADSRDAGAILLEVYLALGNRQRAVDSIDRYALDWRTNSSIAHMAASDAQTWALFPAGRYTSNDKLGFDLEAGDFDAAVRTIEGLHPSVYDGMYEWLDFACVASGAGRADLVKLGLDAALRVKISGDTYDTQRAMLARVLFELGRIEDARAVQARIKYPPAVEAVGKVLSDADPQTLKQCSSQYGGGRTRWYSGGRPHYLQSYALNPDPLAARMKRAASEWEDKTVRGQSRRILEIIAFQALDFRYIHGPWTPS